VTLGPRVSLTLFIQFGFSHNRRLEVFVLVVFFLLVIIAVGISRRHLVAYDSEEAAVTDQVGTLSKAGRIMSACAIRIQPSLM
jgi:hypothetical protein